MSYYSIAVQRWFSLCKVVTPPTSGKVCSWNSLTDDFKSMTSKDNNNVTLPLLDQKYEDIEPADVEVCQFACT